MKRKDGAVRLIDLANKLNLTTTTISHALSDQWKEKRISEHTRDRVVKLAKKWGYRPNVAAVSLRTRKSRTIGILHVGMGDEETDVFRGLEESFGGKYAILVGSSHYSVERELLILESFDSRGVDGLIVYTTSDSRTVRLLQQMIKRGVPVVQIDRHVESLKTSIVEPDNEQIGSLCAQHLIDLGHRNIAFVRSAFVNSNTRDRALGYEKTIRQANLTPFFFPATSFPFNAENNHFVVEAIKSMQIPFGLICPHVSETIGEVERMGLRCPEDVSVCSVDGNSLRMTNLLRIRPTLVTWSLYQMGLLAGQALLRRIEEGPACPGEYIKIPCTLQMGTSTMSPLSSARMV